MPKIPSQPSPLLLLLLPSGVKELLIGRRRRVDSGLPIKQSASASCIRDTFFAFQEPEERALSASSMTIRPTRDVEPARYDFVRLGVERAPGAFVHNATKKKKKKEKSIRTLFLLKSAPR